MEPSADILIDLVAFQARSEVWRVSRASKNCVLHSKSFRKLEYPIPHLTGGSGAVINTQREPAIAQTEPAESVLQDPARRKTEA
jgi:hypothetical protein